MAKLSNIDIANILNNWAEACGVGMKVRPHEEVDLSRYPHSCPCCGSPAYVGAFEVDCLAKCGQEKRSGK